MFLENFDRIGQRDPGYLKITDRSFDQIPEAPEGDYRPRNTRLAPGDVFVFRCYDLKHYAKMKVLEITDDPREAAAWREALPNE